MNSTGAADDGGTGADDGFGLIEVLIAMLILALLALAFAPVMVLGARQTATNATLASGTQFLDQTLDFPRSSSDTCAAIRARAGVVQREDARSTKYTVSTTAAACPSSYPGTVRLDVVVTATVSGEVLSRASTLVYVSAA